MDSSGDKIQSLPHHKQQSLCTTRPPYRQGRKLTAVKVYTVNDESVHLLIHGVPSIGLQSELSTLCERFGRLKTTKPVEKDSSDQEEFTNIFHVQYERIQSARFAKKILDNRSFFGGVLHVCYAPELETINETKLKLVNRKREIAKRTRYAKSNESKKKDQTSNIDEDTFRKKDQTSKIDEDAFKASYQEKYSLGISVPPNSESNLPFIHYRYPPPPLPQEIPVNFGASSSTSADVSCSGATYLGHPLTAPISLHRDANKDHNTVNNLDLNIVGSSVTPEQPRKKFKTSFLMFQSTSLKSNVSSLDPQATPHEAFKKSKAASTTSTLSSSLDTSALGASQKTFDRFKSSTSHSSQSKFISPIVLQQSYKKYGASHSTSEHKNPSKETNPSMVPSTSEEPLQNSTSKMSGAEGSESTSNPLKRRIYETKFLPRSLLMKKKKE